MNEKFLSRGKREDTGKWVKGYYVELPEDQHGKKICLIIGLDGQYNRIIPETAGRCAEIADKNSVLIFEGDIVKIVGEAINAVTEEEQVFAVKYEIKGEFACGFGLLDCFEYEVIGNIHDNPELLERADMPVSNDVFQPVLQPATPENFEIAPA